MSSRAQLTGQTFGKLKVLGRGEDYISPSGSHLLRWKCLCECGNTINATTSQLKRGLSSCGCVSRREDLTGKRFGKLVVLEEAGFIKKSNGRNSRLWKCQCDCGNICYVQHVYLISGDTKSCGCIRSQGEAEIEVLLKEKNISYQKEYEFNDLIDILPLRFDFAIFDKNNNLKCLIEFQGEQHWQVSNGFYNEKVVEHDLLKKEYCKKNKIPLYYLYYKNRNKIQVEWEDLLNIPQIKECIDEL